MKKRLHFQVVIGAAAPVVWQTMLGPQTYKAWTSAFYPGSYFEGSWEKGAGIRFLGPGGDGMVSEIAENREFEFISIRHLGFMRDGVADFDGEEVKAWLPAFENYTFSGQGGATTLDVDLEVTEQYEAMFQESWPPALAALKELCERG